MKNMGQGLRVLIMDDDPDVRERLSNILSRRGYLILTAEDGLEGLEKVIEYKIDVIFCDIFMPKMNGVEFLKKIYASNLKIEIIVVTGNPSIDVCVESFHKNAIEYLTKPLTIEDILNSLAKAEKRIHERESALKTA